MKKHFLYSIFLFSIIATACASSNETTKLEESEKIAMQNKKIFVTVENKKVSATLVDNKATHELILLLQKGNITVKTDDYGGFEKVGQFGYRLPTVNEQISTVAGDIILYQGTSICFYYSKNSWNFTRLGKLDITDEKEIKEFLKAGKGRVDIVLSLF